MPIWPVKKVKIVNLSNYNIIEWSEGTHFIGNNMNEYGARVSTNIKFFDPETMIGKTASGTEYHLQGSPGLDKDGEYLLAKVTKTTEYKLRW